MILLNILKVEEKHSGNQNVARKDQVVNTGLEFRLMMLLCLLFFSYDRASELLIRTVKESPKLSMILPFR